MLEDRDLLQLVLSIRNGHGPVQQLQIPSN